ncbi:Uncharacterised protein [Mycobacterium tuberculosis]|nr:Uncharacterised protein [Mycobacterium tuberculosis]CFB09904.1 Uncharacterised protein [Mycobacterium tuberculosis]CFH40391.1 Uncharacterised protein [Mycobacterium tuberculosis]CKP21567.1 Uncharacterised protein [Mycobacterium tuberculosis]CKR10690.1 Uncharacterised protein [Mycobacterium tuberculosis]
MSGSTGTERRRRGWGYPPERRATNFGDHEQPPEGKDGATVGPWRVGVVQQRNELLPKLLPALIAEPLTHWDQRASGNPVQHRVLAGQLV